MQSTGHSSIHALSLMSTQGAAIVYVTDISSMYCVWAAVQLARRFGRCSDSIRLLILDVAHTRQPLGTPPDRRRVAAGPGAVAPADPEARHATEPRVHRP